MMRFCRSLRISIMLLPALLSLAGETCAAGSDRAQAAQIAPYDHEAYELAHEVFLANGKLQDAFRLSTAAVRQRPNDLRWRRRLADIALWTDRQEVALDQWLVIADREKTTAALDEAIRLARSLGRREQLLKLLGKRLSLSQSPQVWRDYIETAEAIGAADNAQAELTSAVSRGSDPFLLEQLARLSEQKGDPLKALHYLDISVERYGASVARAMEQARINYSRGDFAAALQNMLAARFAATPDDISYWQTLGDLAWSMQDSETTNYAGWLLLSRNKARIDDLERMIILLRESDPEEAYAISRVGWEKFGAPAFFLNLIEIGTARKKWAELNDLYEGLTGAQKETLYAIPYVWICRIQLNEAAGRKEDSTGLFRQALQRFPDNEELMAGYIWSLLEKRDRSELPPVLARGSRLPPQTAVLRTAIGSGYAFLEDDEAALPYFEAEEGEHSADLLWMASYADLLERAGKVERAGEIRKHAWQGVSAFLGQDTASPGARERLAAAVRLAMKIAPGDPADRLAMELASKNEDGRDTELIILWALGSGREELARLWSMRWRVEGTDNTPPWIALQLALRDNDRDKISSLLELHGDEIPLRDRIEANRRIGQPGTALLFAWQALEKKPDDQDLLQQYAELVASAEDRLELLSSYQSRSDLNRFVSEVAATHRIVPSMSIRPSAQFISQSAAGAGYGPIPDSDRSGEIAIVLTGTAGELELAAGVRSAVADFPVFRMRGGRSVTSGTSVSVSAGYGLPAPESVPLLIAGVKDELTVEISRRLSGRDTLNLAATGQLYRDQEGNSLGSGERLSAGYGRRIEASAPGLEFYSTVTGHSFSASGTPGSRAVSLFPAAESSGAAYFIPKSFVQWDAGLFTDRSFMNRYTRRWNAYAGGGLAVNSVSGLGFTGELGGSGPLFGHDSLSATLRMGRDGFGGSDSTLNADIWYTYHLSP